MATDYERYDEPRRGRSLTRALLLILLAFVCGAVAMGYAFSRWDEIGNLVKRAAPGRPQAAVETVPVQPPPLTVVQEPLPESELQARIARVEEQVRRIDNRTLAAAGNADRAEALLLAFAARRALDRGSDLGYIEALLRERFGGSQPRAVATIIGTARQPVTLDELKAGLNAIAPQLTGPGPNESWWTGLRRELAGLIVVRKADQPSPRPGDRLERARDQLSAGHVDLALAEVSRLPGRTAAESWMAQARRYVTARAALDLIETAALLQPSAPGAARAAEEQEWPAPRREPLPTEGEGEPEAEAEAVPAT